MLKFDAFEYICRSPQEIPEEAYSRFHREIGKLLGQPISTMFPDFCTAFPLTVNAMETYWSKPIAGFKRRAATGNWLSSLVLEKPDSNLFFGLRSVSYPLSGPEYDTDHAMLPLKWRELYRWFESFAVTERSFSPMGWKNTPFSYSSRLDLGEYCETIGIKRTLAKDFRKKVGSNRLMCWLLTEQGDALFLDEERRDHKVYHVQHDAFNEVTILINPETTLDRYLCQYISDDPSSSFDFRSSIS